MSIAPPVDKDSIQKALGGVSSLGPGESFVLSGLIGSSKAFFLAETFRSAGKSVLAVLPDQGSAEKFSRDLEFFLGGGGKKVLFHPSTETLPFELQPVHPEIAAARVFFLSGLLMDAGPVIAVTSAENLTRRVMPRARLLKKKLKVEKGKEYPREELLPALRDMGYLRSTMVEERGEVSVRGDIIDIFHSEGSRPVRIELFGDEVESIRTFDLSTQRSERELSETVIIPAGEADLSKEGRYLARDRLIERAEEEGVKRERWEPLSNRLRDGSPELRPMDALLPLFYDSLDTVFDYLPAGTVVALVDPAGVDGAVASSIVDEPGMDESGMYEPGTSFPTAAEEIYMGRSEFNSALGRFPVVRMEMAIGSGGGAAAGAGAEIATESNLDIRQDISLRKRLSPLAERVGGWLKHGWRVFLTAHNLGQARRMRELLEDFSVDIVPAASIMAGGEGGEGGDKGPLVRVAVGTLSSGFRLPTRALAIVTEEEIFGERARRKAPPAKKLDSFLNQLRDLSEGDPIVHTLHGIGLYRSLKRLTLDGMETDFLLIEYRGGDKLYLPVLRMDAVTKYHGVEGRMPELDRLGGVGWEKKKGRVRKAVEKIAGELLKLYAEREAAKGFSFSNPGKLFTEFEAGFEFDETPDQIGAIEDTMGDMGLEKPMDRLICGDVGYGKTEVAMRAAMRAVLDSRQVAVVVPTTVLAQQHYLTFKDRFAPFPVSVEVLSRFRSAKEQRETVDRLASGGVDIIIGTHRLLQKDVAFKDLGLVVIDEEHRFGVKHKERLKTMKKAVDVLTLTATPIPRTLHMSLADIRDLSIINTPPEDRLAIATRVVRFDDDVIKEALEREIRRGGQVFFVHNRVQSMGAMEEFLRRLVPRARVAVAHGQMKEGALEKVMLGFVGGRYDILLSTSIIESGLDIPTANTIVINRADRFGLAELYQLRGRVGRSKHRAYAYLVCPDQASLTPDAQKRIEVIRELSELGSGFRIAAYDLEIRGAGEILGRAQSGKIAEVGFDMYTRLLEEAVGELKGETIEDEIQPEINLKVSQYIPEEYIPDTRQRLNCYKRLASVKTVEEVDGLGEELLDRYGEIPVFVENLLEVSRLKSSLRGFRARELSQKGTRLYLGFDGKPEEALFKRILGLAGSDPRRFRLTPDSRFVRLMAAGASPLLEARNLLQELMER
ncbi:MAG: transcription-repair coupling factor [Thermodesulfobacteriota bacterium]